MSCFCTSQNEFSDFLMLPIHKYNKNISFTKFYHVHIRMDFTLTREPMKESPIPIRYNPVITTPNDLIIFKVLTNSYPEYIMEVKDRSKLLQSKENSACLYSPCHLRLSGNQMIQSDMNPTWCFRQVQKQNQVHKAHGGAQEG